MRNMKDNGTKLPLKFRSTLDALTSTEFETVEGKSKYVSATP